MYPYLKYLNTCLVRETDGNTNFQNDIFLLLRVSCCRFYALTLRDAIVIKDGRTIKPSICKSPIDMDLKTIFTEFYPVSDETINLFFESCDRIEVPKGECVITQGVTSRHIFIVLDGVIRIGCIHSGNEETVLFGTAGDPVFSFHSYYAAKPSIFSVEALTHCTMLKLSFSKFKHLLSQRDDLGKWFYSILTAQIFVFECHYVYLLDRNAESRYQQYRKIRGHIMDKIPLKYAAQYIGISPEHLSRIRRKFK